MYAGSDLGILRPENADLTSSPSQLNINNVHKIRIL